MQTLSSFLKDRPMPVTTNAVWWTEFVLRHDNIEDYLRPPSVGQAWWVKRQIDVWIFAAVLVLALTTILSYMTYLFVMQVIRSLFKNTSKTIITKEKTN